MGILKKFKDILFDEEEYTEQIKITPEMRNEQTEGKKEEKKVVVKKQEEVSKDEQEERSQKVVRRSETRPAQRVSNVDNDESIERPQRAPIRQRVNRDDEQISERELFKSDTTFPFVDFDEQSFEEQHSVRQASREIQRPSEVKRNSNVFEYERRKKMNQRNEFTRHDKNESVDTEKKKFKPSPIISPVYGVLNKDYQKGDILKKEDVMQTVNIKDVRNKAFGEKRENIIREKPQMNKTYEESKTVTIPTIKEKERKVKTIDELLEDTSDVTIDIENDIDNALPELNMRRDKKTSQKEVMAEETLENDLFELIDSMYDNKEDGE